ncbi:MAG: MinD/ParA family ATP-binding protein [Thermoanaerobacteraceae bacterium]
MDQAENLRKILLEKKTKKSRVLIITGGKGGIGKTFISINLSLALRKLGFKVTIIDADLGFSNVEIELGLMPKYTLYDVIYNNRTIAEVINEGPLGINYISSGGDFNLVSNAEINLGIFLSNIKLLDYYSDFVIVDTGAGLNNVVKSFLEAGNEVFVIVTPEPTSIMDAYTLIKYSFKNNDKKINIIINKAKNFEEYREVYNRFDSVVKNYLGINVYDIGYLEYDYKIMECIKEQKPIILKYENSKTSKSFMAMAAKIADRPFDVESGGVFSFFNKLFKRGI